MYYLFSGPHPLMVKRQSDYTSGPTTVWNKEIEDWHVTKILGSFDTIQAYKN